MSNVPGNILWKSAIVRLLTLRKHSDPFSEKLLRALDDVRILTSLHVLGMSLLMTQTIHSCPPCAHAST